MTFFSRTEVNKMSKTRATRCLRDLKKLYDTETPLSEADFFQRVWPKLDDITNTILYLEDHIQALETSENISIAVRAQKERARLEQEQQE